MSTLRYPTHKNTTVKANKHLSLAEKVGGLFALNDLTRT